MNKLDALSWEARRRGISYGELSAHTTEDEREAIYEDYERELARRREELEAKMRAAKERRRKPRPKPPEFDEAKARKLYDTGLTDPEIGRLLGGLQAWRVRDWRYKNNLPGNTWKKERDIT